MVQNIYQCVTRKCDTANTPVADAAFMKDAALNLDKARKQVQSFPPVPVPPALQPVKDYLLKDMERGLEREAALYTYLKSGDLGPMRQILCKLCACGKPEEVLLAQLRATTDPAEKILLAGEWHNRANHCEKRPTYPMEAWAQFLNENGITERRTYQRID
jgi:hypothetical protein